MFPSKYYLDTSDALRADRIPSFAVPPPDTVRLPMSQHVGLPAVPAVKISDEVLRGQVIGEAAPNGLSLPVHSPIDAHTMAQGAFGDKKRRGGSITLVLPNEVGNCSLVPFQLEELEAFFSDGMDF